MLIKYSSINYKVGSGYYIADQNLLYLSEFLNTLTLPGLPNHKLKLKLGLPIVLIQNLNQNASLCNGTRSVNQMKLTYSLQS